MYLEPSSQLTTRTPNASLWSFAKIAFAKLVRSEFSRSASQVLHLGKFVSPDRRTGVESMDEDSNVGEISKTFADTSSQQLEHRPEDQCGMQVVERHQTFKVFSINKIGNSTLVFLHSPVA